MDSAVSTLTDRERDVLLLAAKAYQNEEIARRLGITPATVKVHVRNARLKLGGASRGAAARLVQDTFDANNAGGTPSEGTANPPIFLHSVLTENLAPEPGERVREAPWLSPDLLPARTSEPENASAQPSHLTKLVMVAAASLLVVMLLLLAKPITDEFQRWGAYFNKQIDSRPR